MTNLQFREKNQEVNSEYKHVNNFFTFSKFYPENYDFFFYYQNPET